MSSLCGLVVEFAFRPLLAQAGARQAEELSSILVLAFVVADTPSPPMAEYLYHCYGCGDTTILVESGRDSLMSYRGVLSRSLGSDEVTPLSFPTSVESMPDSHYVKRVWGW
ncbi:uncharacterized protein EI90DRAFT_3052184 [Cantharellus anzutake]|uniref:uncharacterized protein n=1 Tax=Cantharellus anzutake TaxID=1750568 RepID=UPI00190348BF|nr:uncharacterized protein EI90DRAFT_3052184 [Cantharellus anzutake]KAF8333489.1 hypothetical protein EI90DRAFT_3052184 [Cantharellus anzutake]